VHPAVRTIISFIPGVMANLRKRAEGGATCSVVQIGTTSEEFQARPNAGERLNILCGLALSQVLEGAR